LVEEFWGFVDVVVGACVRTTDDLNGQRVVVDEVVVDRGFEEVGVFL